MAKKLTSVVGIDIGSEFIKICEIKTQGRDPIVSAMGITATPEGAVDHTGIFNPEAVSAALKQVIGESGVTVQSAVVTITGQNSVLVRTLEVPKMNATELKEHMQWEINRNIPFAESTILSDYKPLGDDDPNSANMDVVMAISPQSAIDTLIQCVKKSGRSPAAIDVEPLSLARTLRTNYDDLYPQSTVCLVDVGAKTTSINMYKGGKLLMPRQVPIGGELFTRAIADAYTIGIKDAEAMKCSQLEIPESASYAQDAPFATPGSTQEFQPYNPFSDDPVPPFTPAEDPHSPAGYGGPGAFDPMGGAPDPIANGPVDHSSVPDSTSNYATPPVDSPSNYPLGSPEPNKLFQSVAAVLDEFVSEIRRSVDYFRSRGGDLDALLLCGGGSKIRGLSQYLSKTLGIQCDAYDPIRRLNVNARKLPPEFTEEHKSEFAVAIGNGLYVFYD
jgi:type IV pilus assembly protein PilM